MLISSTRDLKIFISVVVLCQIFLTWKETKPQKCPKAAVSSCRHDSTLDSIPSLIYAVDRTDNFSLSGRQLLALYHKLRCYSDFKNTLHSYTYIFICIHIYIHAYYTLNLINNCNEQIKQNREIDHL